jgi:fructose-1,6-bisphosphatase I
MAEKGEVISLRNRLGGHASRGTVDEGLARVISDLAGAAVLISAKVARAAISDMLGEAGSVNVHGEDVKKLDLYANDLLVEIFRNSGSVCGMASEEVEDIIAPSQPGHDSDYVVLFDPLDGSSNIDVNVSIGTIFSIYRRRSAGGPAVVEDFLRRGREQVAAGYFAYGSSTMLVYTAGDGVDGFTMDPESGEFLLSHPMLTTPERGKIYSCNEGNSHKWEDGTRNYVASLKTQNGTPGRPYSARYVGSFVADIHRNLIKGGIFLYPADRKPDGSMQGKLRLMYEANPMAMVVGQAGGSASDGRQQILNIEPTDIHQRVAVAIGSRQDVEDYSGFLAS